MRLWLREGAFGAGALRATNGTLIKSEVVVVWERVWRSHTGSYQYYLFGGF